jgi:hypothetical protein
MTTMSASTLVTAVSHVCGALPRSRTCASTRPEHLELGFHLINKMRLGGASRNTEGESNLRQANDPIQDRPWGISLSAV